MSHGMRTRVTSAVGEVVVRIARGLVLRYEIEHIAIELRHLDWMHSAHRDVIDVARVGLAIVIRDRSRRGWTCPSATGRTRYHPDRAW